MTLLGWHDAVPRKPMLARPAVLPTPSTPLLVCKPAVPVTSLESTLVQVFILKHFKPPRINTYEKGGGGAWSDLPAGSKACPACRTSWGTARRARSSRGRASADRPLLWLGRRVILGQTASNALPEPEPGTAGEIENENDR